MLALEVSTTFLYSRSFAFTGPAGSRSRAS